MNINYSQPNLPEEPLHTAASPAVGREEAAMIIFVISGIVIIFLLCVRAHRIESRMRRDSAPA